LGLSSKLISFISLQASGAGVALLLGPFPFIALLVNAVRDFNKEPIFKLGASRPFARSLLRSEASSGRQPTG